MQKWQLGTAFLPDSVGYLVGTSCTAGPAYRFGRWKAAILAMLLLAIATAMVSHYSHNQSPHTHYNHDEAPHT